MVFANEEKLGSYTLCEQRFPSRTRKFLTIEVERQPLFHRLGVALVELDLQTNIAASKADLFFLVIPDPLHKEPSILPGNL